MKNQHIVKKFIKAAVLSLILVSLCTCSLRKSEPNDRKLCAETWDGTATSSKYYDCAGGSCGCAYGESWNPVMCPSNSLFAAPQNNEHGAKFYGTAAVSTDLGGDWWLGPACGKCFKLKGLGNIEGSTSYGQETVVVVKANNFCSPEDSNCGYGKKHFNLQAPGFHYFSWSQCNDIYPFGHSLNGEQPCHAWMIADLNPHTNCECSQITESETLRNGCENFLSLGWNDPTVEYKQVACPQELLDQPCWQQNGNQYPSIPSDTCLNHPNIEPQTNDTNSTSTDTNSTSTDTNSTSTDTNSTSTDTNSTSTDDNSTSTDTNSTSTDTNSTSTDDNSTSTDNSTEINWDGTASSTRYYDCSGGACGCAYGNSQYPTMCPSNSMFQAPANNQYGATYYGTAAVSADLGGDWWLGSACGKCWLVQAQNNIPRSSEFGKKTTIVIKGTNFCPPSNWQCDYGRKHFDIAAPGFDWSGASQHVTCHHVYPSTHSLVGEQPCANWMINSDNPNKNCDCSKITEDQTLRNGCQNFKNLGWDNPTVYYKSIPCPQELIDSPPCWEQNGNDYPATPSALCSNPPAF